VTDTTSRVHGIRNLRDLGGLETADNRRVAHHRLYRSGSPHELTDAGKLALEELGVRIVIDLRSQWERRQRPYEWPGCRIVSAPLVADQLVTSIHARLKTGMMSSEELEDWWQLTRVFQAPEEHLASIRVVFDSLQLADPGNAVLLHCQGGKDRTGLISALVLVALGVTREAVFADFMLSNPTDDDRSTPGLAAIIEATAPDLLSDGALASLTGVKQEWIETLLEGIEDRHGSVERYLTEHVGIGDHGRARLQEMYLEPAGSATT
jgi:protein-tyrosine phosphatase